MSTGTFGYALFTLQTGHRPLSAFAEIFEHLCSSIIPKLDELEQSSGTTRRRGLEITLSNTAILMTYSLAEGFFFEEYKFYLGKEPPRKQTLDRSIKELLTKLKIADEKIDLYIETLIGLRGARNAIVHRNGLLTENEKKKMEELFGATVCTGRGYPVANAFAMTAIIHDISSLISRYSELAVQSVSQV